MARVVIGNAQVLAAGTRIEQEVAEQGKAIPSTVVTLVVSPQDAELVGLAATEGQIMLTLRNPLDTAPTPSTGTYSTRLAGDAARAEACGVRRCRRPASAAAADRPTRRRRPKPIEVIRAGKIGKEIIK